MLSDPQLLRTFCREARAHLRRLDQDDVDDSAYGQAAQGLEQAAAMLGLDGLERQARELLTTGARLSPQQRAERVQQMATELERVERELAQAPQPALLPEQEADDEAWDPETEAMLHQIFADEAQGHLEAISRALLRLTEQADPQAGREMLRKVHTLKGSASTVGLNRVAQAAHLFEEHLVGLGLAATGDWTQPATARLGEGELARLRHAVQGLAQMAGQINRQGDAAQGQLDQLARLLGGDATQWAAGGEARAHDDAPRRQATAAPETAPAEELTHVRVDVTQLDRLMDAVGELVIQRTRVEQRIAGLRGLTRDLRASHRELGEQRSARQHEVELEIADVLANLERLTEALRDDSEAMERTGATLRETLNTMRLMPLRWLQARLQRPLRELAASQHKQARLLMDGESVQIDRLALEQLTDPLIQLVRNAVAHGIETPAVRRAAGKPAQGTIRVRARQKGDLILLQVRDDGAGLDVARLRHTLLERGLASPEQVERMSEDQLVQWIFASGFTTRTHADTLAGRGMGLSVVQHNIQQLGGEVQVESSAAKGCTFSIRLPVYAAITPALLFKVGEPVYAIPVGYVLQCRLVDAEQQVRLEGEEAQLRLHEQWIPLIQLHRYLGGAAPPALAPRGSDRARPLLPVVVLSFADQRFAISCSRVVGPREIALKPLGPVLGALPLVAGATISGSSKVQLVLDVVLLSQMAREHDPRLLPDVLQGPRGREPQPPRILVVDDSLAVRAAASHILRGAGFITEDATDGWEAWGRLQQQDFDLLITDLEMPRLHGLELIQRCRRGGALDELPVLVLSSRTSARDTALSAGGQHCAFLAKPVRRHALLQAVERLLPQRPDPS